MAYYEMDPFGGERGDVRTAHQTAMLANMMRGKDAKALSVDDCQVKFKAAAPEPKSMLDTVRMWNGLLGGVDKLPKNIKTKERKR